MNVLNFHSGTCYRKVMTYTVAALYRFVPISDVERLAADLKAAFSNLGIYGTLLIAPEGINGTLAATEQSSIDTMIQMLADVCGLGHAEFLLDVKFSKANHNPFQKLKILKKREIITFKQPSADPNVQVGHYVAAKDWNDLVTSEDVLVLDTRNTYETGIGTFEGAVVPPIERFTEFAEFVRTELATQKHKKVAMFCTGGIRCEKASSFMLSEGFSEVYHLQGGILKYLEEIPEENSLWQGDCFVFDQRIGLGHGLKVGSYTRSPKTGEPVEKF